MRLTDIEYHGYKRLANAKINVDGKIIAILGPNDKGKTSALEGLVWLTDDNAGALPRSVRTRGEDVPDKQYVVVARFALDDGDLKAIAHLDRDGSPAQFSLWKTAGGTPVAWSSPLVKWRAEPFDAALEDLELAGRRVDLTSHAEAHKTVVALLTDAKDRRWTVPEVAAVTMLADQLDLGYKVIDAVESLSADDPLATAGNRLRALAVQCGKTDPNDELQDVLDARCPEFVLFGPNDRILRTTYDLTSDEQPSALHNLLRLGGTTVEELLATLRSNDITDQAATFKRVNAELRERLRPTWRQSDLTVELDFDGTTIRVLINELHDNGAITAIEERSEGLRTFIALVSFLESRTAKGAPILLIDEAERSLHVDGQADLVDVLLRQTVARQVLYTTHSLECLPPDLGTRLRFVTPSPTNPNVSELKADFWHNSPAGYDELRIMAGASAAVFNTCRRAVVAEGPSEMILLPSLIRIATGETELLYQVVTGLATTSTTDPALLRIAARTAYLVDGDAAGRTKRRKLIATGIPEHLIFSLPAGVALEDLLTTTSYLWAVNEHLKESGHRGDPITQAALAHRRPYATSVKVWCEEHGVKAPGKRAIAHRLVENIGRVELTPAATDALCKLHVELNAILDV